MSHLRQFNLTTTELTSNLSAKNAKRPRNKRYPDGGGQLIRAYIDWQIESDAFVYALVVSKLDRGMPLPLICASSDDLVANMGAFVERGRKGFELLFSSRMSAQEHATFFARFELEVGDKRITDAWDSPLISAAWNKDALRAALKTAMCLGARTYCTFGHDADPVYLMEPSSL